MVRDFVTFCEMLVYWPFVLVVMLPLKYVDRALGTHFLPPLIRLCKWIANL